MTKSSKQRAERKEDVLGSLLELVRARRILLIRLSDEHSLVFAERRSIGRGFTMSVSPSAVNDLRTPTLCVVFGASAIGGAQFAQVGIISSKRHLTSIERGIKIAHAAALSLDSIDSMVDLVETIRAKRDLERRLRGEDSVILLPPDLSARVVGGLANRPENLLVLQRIAAHLRRAPRQHQHAQLQADAIKSALTIFGLAGDAEATTLNLPGGMDTALSTIWLREDSVVEHDARRMPEMRLEFSHVTGHARFRRGDELLEVYTANRKPLERVFGVDLVYSNLRNRSLVMVQYKMLDPQRSSVSCKHPKDWIYRPDTQLAKEIRRMKLFERRFASTSRTYRLNSSIFYMKFVKRDALDSTAAITIPLEHFEQLRVRHKTGIGVRAVRISYNDLNGAYLRNPSFFELIRSGYIGASEVTTELLMPLVRALVRGDRAVVLAVQKAMPADDSVFERTGFAT